MADIISKHDIDILDDLMQKLISKLQLLGMSKEAEKLDSVCYDILYKAECKAEGM